MSDNDVVVSIEPGSLGLGTTRKGARQRPQQQAMAAAARSVHDGHKVRKSTVLQLGLSRARAGSAQMNSRAIGTGRRDSMSIAALHAGESSSDLSVNAELKPVHPAAFLIGQQEGPGG